MSLQGATTRHAPMFFRHLKGGKSRQLIERRQKTNNKQGTHPHTVLGPIGAVPRLDTLPILVPPLHPTAPTNPLNSDASHLSAATLPHLRPIH
ncbi:hypothetical protein Hypma_005611 [Hypsizygus marmoreus]|uniref:Uncharacterized protein n=1 Tax=Hypsizygus marmoreus TaxID=39966 RepID=A0A369K6P0_HYPMA|nr:hypothetical protein Hypma_005611 [Hypsizygus marmoreus]